MQGGLPGAQGRVFALHGRRETLDRLPPADREPMLDQPYPCQALGRAIVSSQSRMLMAAAAIMLCLIPATRGIASDEDECQPCQYYTTDSTCNNWRCQCEWEPPCRSSPALQGA